MSKEELRLSILRELKVGKQPRHEEYDVTEELWNSTASFLNNEGYIKNITISRNTKYMFTELTEKGEEYLREKSL
ncbi:YjcQ family protein [Neobacillus drentensis]|uniref:YjcQ family protein n=1 Tax=Neobacillus drentensis TaxID=220684 RepID=UPI002FFF31FC